MTNAQLTSQQRRALTVSLVLLEEESTHQRFILVEEALRYRRKLCSREMTKGGVSCERFHFSSHERPRQSLDYRTPWEVRNSRPR